MYVWLLCASCRSPQCCGLYDLQYVNAGRGCKGRPYGRDILQSRSHDYLIGSQECLLLFAPCCCGECLIMCRGVWLNCDVVNMCVVCECWV